MFHKQRSGFAAITRCSCIHILWVSESKKEEPEMLMHGAGISILSLSYILEAPTLLAALEAVKAWISHRSCDRAGKSIIHLSWCLLLAGKQRFRGMGACSHWHGTALCPPPDRDVRLSFMPSLPNNRSSGTSISSSGGWKWIEILRCSLCYGVSLPCM